MREIIDGAYLQDQASYELAQQQVARVLFDKTRQMYTPEQLAAGVYAEIHGEAERSVIGLSPRTARHLAVPWAASHSVFDAVLGNDFFGNRSVHPELRKITPAIQFLGLRRASVTARGVYHEWGNKRSVTLLEHAINELEPRTVTH